MSIQSEITRISNAVDDTKTAIGEKGVEVPNDATVDDLPTLVRSIKTEGGGGGGGGTSGSQTGVVDTSASYRIIYTYFPDAVSVTVPTRVVTATSAVGELQA